METKKLNRQIWYATIQPVSAQRVLARRVFTGTAILILMAALTACAMQPVGQAPESPLQAPDSPLAAAGPQVDVDEVSSQLPFALAEGTGGVRGRLFSSITNNTVKNEGVYLASFICPGDVLPHEADAADCFWLFESLNSPAALTDDTGYFEFRDLDPGGYLFFVGELNLTYAFYETEDERPIPFVVEAGEITELGNVIVAYPH
jgi:hypothetical protein